MTYCLEGSRSIVAILAIMELGDLPGACSPAPTPSSCRNPRYNGIG